MRTPRELYTQKPIVYSFEMETCPECGGPLKVTYVSGTKTVQTMEQVSTIAQRPKHCAEPDCKRYQVVCKSARWQQIAPLHCTYGRSDQTTPPSQSSVEWVTIIHPCHPLYSQRMKVVGLYRSDELWITVQLPDGVHARIPAAWTDYGAPLEGDLPTAPRHLLDLEGLRQVIQVIDRIRRDGRGAACLLGEVGQDE